jgi:hypothetical protein
MRGLAGSGWALDWFFWREVGVRGGVPMRLCVCCAVELPEDQLLCPHHHEGFLDAAWARWNRLLCDLLHRGIEPPPLERIDAADESPVSEPALVSEAAVCAVYVDA